VVERIQKILALGRRGGTEAEAAAAMAKAQKLLEEHNLTLAQVDQAQQGTARREELAQAGGMYHYQRELWQAVAQLNFCIYFRHGEWIKKRGRNRWRSKHCFVGRVVNTRSTMAMGTYLEGEIERLCRERLRARVQGWSIDATEQSQYFSSWAVAFREGVSDRVIRKLAARRRQRLADEAERAKKAAEASGFSTSTALTLADVEDREYQANYDHVMGEGAYAKKMADRAAEAAERAAEEKAWAEYAAAHPEEARKKEAEMRKQRRTSSGRAPKERRIDMGGYRAGLEAGESVSIDPQAEGTRVAGRLR
jgi:hypothetical protein